MPYFAGLSVSVLRAQRPDWRGADAVFRLWPEEGDGCGHLPRQTPRDPHAAPQTVQTATTDEGYLSVAGMCASES